MKYYKFLSKTTNGFYPTSFENVFQITYDFKLHKKKSSRRNMSSSHKSGIESEVHVVSWNTSGGRAGVSFDKGVVTRRLSTLILE